MGGRFCSLDQTHLALQKYYSENYVIPSPKLNAHQKKEVFAENWSVFFCENYLKTKQKKRSSPEIEAVFGQN